MNKRFSILILLLVATLYSTAQNSLNRNALKASISTIKAYTDSLNEYKLLLKEALDSNEVLKEKLELNRKRPESYLMLTPLTYFRVVPSRSLGNRYSNYALDSYDRAMTLMYLTRPDLVKDSEKNLTETGGIVYKQDTPMTQEVNLTKQSEEENKTETEDLVAVEPIELIQVRPNFWDFLGDYSLQFLQNYVSANWYKGGVSNYAMIGGVILQINYNDKNKVKFDNKIELKLGMQSSQGDSIHAFKSSEDLIRLTSKLGVQASKNWYYTLQVLAETQFTHGYKTNDMTVYSDFFSPLKLNLSLGMDYKLSWLKKKITGTVNISPLAVNYKYYDRESNALAAGYSEGHKAKWDLGSTFTADLNWKFSDIVKWQTRLYAFTTYHRTEVEWENTFTVQLSKYISTKLFVYPRFDDSVKKRDDTYGFFQLKEYWSLGFNYTM